MASNLAKQVRRKIAAYLDATCSLRDLWQWLVTHVEAVEADLHDADVNDVAGKTLLYLHEWSHGHRSEAELRDLLRSLLTERTGVTS